MTVKELITKLEKLNKTYGNVEVYVLDTYEGIDEINYVDIAKSQIDEKDIIICIGNDKD